MEFEFVVLGVPRTGQTKSKKSRSDWKQRVKEAALAAWPKGRRPISTELGALIVHFYTETTDIDVDGIGKLILDALREVVIEDDNIVSQILLRKTNQIGLSFSNPPLILAETLGSVDSFVYVRLGDAPRHEELFK